MGTRLFVGNLPFDVTEQQISDLFNAAGQKAVSVKIVTDRDTGRSRGFAFVDMESEDAVKHAITELNGRDLGGRPLRINEAEERAGGRGFGGGGGGGGGFRSTPHGGDRGHGGGFGSRGPGQGMPRGSQRGGGRGGTRGS